MILHGAWQGCNIAAIMDGKATSDLYIERADQPNLVGAIAQGKITQVRAGGLQAFMTLPDGLTGFLTSKTQLKTGQLKTVQISSYASGNKACPVSTELKQASHALIHVLNGKSISASSRLPAAQAATLKEALKAAKLPGGWIIRHHAAGYNVKELLEEAQAMLATQPDLTVRDGWLVTAPTVLQRAILEAPKAKPTAFENWDDLLTPLLQPEIAFGDGSRITISPTPALTAIDIDAGRASNIQSVNVGAAKLIARALRARQIGGQVVIDFCRGGDRPALLKALGQELAEDPLRVTLYGTTKLGLVELTRPRMGAALHEVIDAQ